VRLSPKGETDLCGRKTPTSL